MIEHDLRNKVLASNLRTVRDGLVLATFGNASGINRESGIVAIKPSGISYDEMTVDDIVTVDIDAGVHKGQLKASSDLDTHLVLYRAFRDIGAVIHTHSTYATIFAQAKMPIPCLGTTHADYFRGEIPVTRSLTESETAKNYVQNTGIAIVETLQDRDPLEVPAVLVAHHGPFVWGRTPNEAALNAQILEQCALMAWYTTRLNPEVEPIADHLRDRHFDRKHGATATYGQAGRR